MNSVLGLFRIDLCHLCMMEKESQSKLMLQFPRSALRVERRCRGGCQAPALPQIPAPPFEVTAVITADIIQFGEIESIQSRTASSLGRLDDVRPSSSGTETEKSKL